MTAYSLPFPRKRVSVLISALLALAFSPPGMAAPTDASNINSVLNLSLEELMQVTVTSASKKEQSLAETAAAVFVITNDDIRRSGATNIPEALRLAPGVQVAAYGQNRWAVSIRGFNSRFSNKLLVLVDGRAIYNTSFSGVYWEHNDIPLSNIERIEVVRGPGGSLWGANAVNGVINIITYSAKDTQGGLLSVAAGDEVHGIGQARYGWKLDEETFLRLNAQAKSIDPGQAVAGGDGPDYWKNQQAGFRLDATRSGDKLSLQGNISDYKAGDKITAILPSLPFTPTTTTLNTDGAGQTAHLLGRWERPAASGAHSLQAFIDHGDTDLGPARYKHDTFDLEYQQQIKQEQHDIVWGLGYRYTKDQITTTPYLFFSDKGQSFNLYSAFIQDDITLVPNRWRLTLGARLEHNDFTGVEVQPNIRLLWTPSAQDSVWAALSHAVRTPSRGERASTVFVRERVDLPVLPFLIPAMATVGSNDMAAEKLEALDLGWRRQWTPTLTSEVAAFYYRHSDLRGAVPGSAPLFDAAFNPYMPLYISNVLGADSYGMEASLDWLPRTNWRLQANVSLFDLKARNTTPTTPADEFIGATPYHQISLRSSLDITPQLQWDVWLRHTGKVKGGATPLDDVSAYSNLDMRLAWKARRDLEIALVGQNLLKSSHQEFISTHLLSVPVKIERGVYLKADWKF